MPALLVAIAASLMFALLPGDPCKLCQDRGAVACNRCEGKGARPVPCSRCNGERKVVCPLPRCDGGRYLCPACDGGKVIVWKSGETDPCRYCAQKGSFRCAYCKAEGKVDCIDCKGKGRLSVPCGACLGVKAMPCPLTRGTKPCVACGGTKSLACGACDGVGTLAQRCEKCHGWELSGCECAGGRAQCPKCFGVGKIRFVSTDNGTAMGTEKCNYCSTTGGIDCKKCGGPGWLPCAVKPVVNDCARCDQGRIACPRCVQGGSKRSK